MNVLYKKRYFSSVGIDSSEEGKEYLVNVWQTDLSINDPQKDDAYQEYKEKVKEDILHG